MAKPNDIEERIEKLREKHPYKVPTDRNTYSEYNEAWQDAIDAVLDEIKQAESNG